MSEHSIREYLKTIGNGGGGVQQETDPVFTASPAYEISSQDIADWNDKQDELVSGTNIKTINGTSLLGSGDIPVAPSVTSTDVPTADTIAEFDSDAHMNSTDMTTGSGSELENFIDGLNVSGGSAFLDMFYPVGSIYQTTDDSFDPNISWGGTWVLIEEGRFLQATETSGEGGDAVSAGLPNIKGTYTLRSMNYNTGQPLWASGLFSIANYTGQNADGFTQANGSINTKLITFDASKANSIYGNSTTVQPPAIKTYMWHRTA